MVWIYIGLALFFSMIMSGIIGLSLQYLTGGMYGSFFKNFSPSVFVSLNYVLSFGIPLIVAIIFAKQTNLRDRLPNNPVPGRGEFIIGGLVVLAPQALHILTSSIPGGGASFALFSVAAPVIAIGKILIFVGAIRLLMAVKPSPEYIYPVIQTSTEGSNGVNHNTL